MICVFFLLSIATSGECKASNPCEITVFTNYDQTNLEHFEVLVGLCWDVLFNQMLLYNLNEQKFILEHVNLDLECSKLVKNYITECLLLTKDSSATTIYKNLIKNREIYQKYADFLWLDCIKKSQLSFRINEERHKILREIFLLYMKEIQEKLIPTKHLFNLYILYINIFKLKSIQIENKMEFDNVTIVCYDKKSCVLENKESNDIEKTLHIGNIFLHNSFEYVIDIFSLETYFNELYSNFKIYKNNLNSSKNYLRFINEDLKDVLKAHNIIFVNARNTSNLKHEVSLFNEHQNILLCDTLKSYILNMDTINFNIFDFDKRKLQNSRKFDMLFSNFKNKIDWMNVNDSSRLCFFGQKNINDNVKLKKCLKVTIFSDICKGKIIEERAALHFDFFNDLLSDLSFVFPNFPIKLFLNLEKNYDHIKLDDHSNQAFPYYIYIIYIVIYKELSYVFSVNGFNHHDSTLLISPSIQYTFELVYKFTKSNIKPLIKLFNKIKNSVIFYDRKNDLVYYTIVDKNSKKCSGFIKDTNEYIQNNSTMLEKHLSKIYRLIYMQVLYTLLTKIFTINGPLNGVYKYLTLKYIVNAPSHVHELYHEFDFLFDVRTYNHIFLPNITNIENVQDDTIRCFYYNLYLDNIIYMSNTYELYLSNLSNEICQILINFDNLFKLKPSEKSLEISSNESLTNSSDNSTKKTKDAMNLPFIIINLLNTKSLFFEIEYCKDGALDFNNMGLDTFGKLFQKADKEIFKANPFFIQFKKTIIKVDFSCLHTPIDPVVSLEEVLIEIYGKD
ncbi:hypothetical protein COBT_001373 [Conglomerata obtusa]